MTENYLRRTFEGVLVFTKAQVSAFTGGIADYLLMIYLTEVFHIHYTLSIVIGGIIGAVVNFTLNKTWTFRSNKQPYKHSGTKQFLKFVLVVLNCIVLKVSGTYLFTTYFKTDYYISRIMTDLTVSLAFNYTLQKFWVFRKRTQLQPYLTEKVTQLSILDEVNEVD
jgi:putative flippase GtrA